MQTATGQGSTNTLSTQSRTIATMAILLFAFAGLISGFAVGAFVRSSQPQQVTNPNPVLNPPIQGKTKTATPTTRSRPEYLGEPVIDQIQYFETTDGNTNYTFAAHAINSHQQPIHKEGITCKLWLTQDGNVTSNMPASRLSSINTLDQPFPKEDVNALNFDPTTRQIQPCAAGQGNWTYKISSSLAGGTYYLVVLMDWNGAHYNWAWDQITIKK